MGTISNDKVREEFTNFINDMDVPDEIKLQLMDLNEQILEAKRKEQDNAIGQYICEISGSVDNVKKFLDVITVHNTDTDEVYYDLTKCNPLQKIFREKYA